MKRALLLLAICSLFLSGCLSFEVEDENLVGAALKEVALEEGVIFKWDSATTPLPELLPADTPIRSGYRNIFFRVRGNSALTTTNGAIRMGNDNRLIIGATSTESTGPDTHIPGVLDLSEGTYRLIVDYKDATRGGNFYILRVFINNNNPGQLDSVLGPSSVLRQFTTVNDLRSGGEQNRFVIAFTPGTLFANSTEAGFNSLKNAFISFNCQMDSRITITGIRLEKQRPAGSGKRIVNPDLTKDYVLYSEFGAVGDGKADDFAAIVDAHATANRHNKKVRADAGAVYYIGGDAATARIETDTDWTGAEFIIDDSKVELNGRAWSDSWIFDIASVQRMIPVTNVRSINKNQAKLNLSLPSSAVIVAIDFNTKQYIRRGENQNSGSDQTDAFIVDKDGNVDKSSPILWDFKKFTSLTAYLIDETVLTVKGGKFTTIANRGFADANYMKRGIRVLRSNTVLDGIIHVVIGEGEQGAAYDGFFKAEACANVTVQNSTLAGHRGYRQSDGPTRGTYDIHPNRVINFSVINCDQSDSIHDGSHWGVFVSNYSKNIILDNVKFSRFDAHLGVHNAVILNSEFGHQNMNIIGSGLLRIENTKVSSDRFINFRPDYGSTWEGELIMRNCTFVPTRWSSPTLFVTDNDGQWNFGYPCFMPETITISGLTIDETNAPSDYAGINLISGTNTGARELYPYTLAKTINLSGYVSKKPYRIENEYYKREIRVNAR